MPRKSEGDKRHSMEDKNISITVDDNLKRAISSKHDAKTIASSMQDHTDDVFSVKITNKFDLIENLIDLKSNSTFAD